MVFKAVVRDGTVQLPPDANLPDGTVVRVESSPARPFRDLLDLAGTWEGDDADQIIDEIYARRCHAAHRMPLES